MPNGTLSAIAAFAITVSAALASGAGLNSDAGAATADTLTKSDAVAHAAAVFHRADQNKDARLNADEFASLAIVTAELAHLNGYIEIEGDAPRLVALPIDRPSALSVGERARIEAVARNTFYSAAQGDGALNEAEFVAVELERFRDADRNRNGALRKSELAKFALSQAQFTAGA